MAKLIGMGGHVTVGEANYPVSEWSVTANNDVQDVTDTGSGGWQEMIPGINSAEVTFKAWWGSSVALLSATFAVGNLVGCVFNIGGSGVEYSGNFIIKSFTVTNNAKTPVEFSCTGVSTGAVGVS